MSIEQRKVELDRLLDAGTISAREYETLLDLARTEMSIPPPLPKSQQVKVDAFKTTSAAKPNVKALGAFVAVIAVIVALILNGSKDPKESREYLKLVETKEELLGQKNMLETELAELEAESALPKEIETELEVYSKRVERWDAAISQLKAEFGK